MYSELGWLAAFLHAAACSVVAGSPTWPLNLELSAKASGMQGLANVYSVDITVGRDGPLSLLVDTGSPAVVVQGDFSAASAPPPTGFLSTDNDGTATINFGGSTVSGDITRSRVCFNQGKPDLEKGGLLAGQRFCLKDFPVFEVQTKDAGFSQLGLDGVLGLGPVSGQANLGLSGLDETVLDGFAGAGAAARIFGVFISPGPLFGPSMLSVGGYDSTRIQRGAELQYIPLAQPPKGRWELSLQAVRLVTADGSAQEVVDVCQARTDCRVLLDSGTAQIASVPELTNALSSSLRNTASDGCVGRKSMPDLHIEFAGGIVFKLGPEDYVLDSDACSLAVDEMTANELAREKSVTLILGEPFFRNVYAVFDQDQGRVGLAPSVATRQQTQNEAQREEATEERAEAKHASLLNYFGNTVDLR